MHLSKDQLTFLAGFARSAQGHGLKKLLEDRLAEVDKELRSLTGENLYRAQGRALMLDELIATFDEAQTRLERSQSARSQGQRQPPLN